jgi:hypothetical protein
LHLAEVGSYGIEPSKEAVISPQRFQFLVGVDKHFLSHVLGIVKVAESGVSQSIDALFVFIHQQTEGCRVSIEAFVYDTTIICPHSIAPVKFRRGSQLA